MSKKLLSLLIWTWGGTTYFLLEVLYKSIRGEPEKISWTMLVLAIFLCIPIERAGCELPWEYPLLLQAFICAVLVTVCEFFAGLILNVWLNMNIWDYSNLPLNLCGQICLRFFLLWWLLCLVFIPVFDWFRYLIEGTEKPRYSIIKFRR